MLSLRLVIKLLLRRQTNKTGLSPVDYLFLEVFSSIILQQQQQTQLIKSLLEHNVFLQHWSRLNHYVSCCYAITFLALSWVIKRSCPPAVCPPPPQSAYSEQGDTSAGYQSRGSLSFALHSSSSHTLLLVLLNGLQEGLMQKPRLLVNIVLLELIFVHLK